MYKVVSNCRCSLECVFPYISHEYNNYLCNSVKYQSYRWKRKPWWLPTAKSKMFRIPQHKKLPEEENAELKNLWNHYRTEMKSIRIYMTEKLQMSMTGAEVLAEQARLVEEDHMNCIKINDEWNSQIKKIRETRIAKEKEEQMIEILKTLELNEKQEAERKAKAEALVREEKEKAKFYITSANIDTAIEEALSKEIDFNFAIDLECNILKGRLAKPDPNDLPPESIKIAQSN